MVDDCLEDWIRTPADPDDLAARCATLLQRAAAHTPASPHLDDAGFLHHGEMSLHIPPLEARLLAELLANPGAVVGRERLLRAGWAGGRPTANGLDVHMARLRRRLAPLGLVITTVRSRGYLLGPPSPSPSPSPAAKASGSGTVQEHGPLP